MVSVGSLTTAALTVPMVVTVAVAMPMAMAVTVAMTVAISVFISRIGSDTPKSVTSPGTFLTFLAAVFGPSAAATLRELTLVLFPLATLPICTLSDSSLFIFAAEITHDHTSPVLHVALLWRVLTSGGMS